MDNEKRPAIGNGKACYVEIPALDIDRSASFYKEVFGWQIRTRGDGCIDFDDGAGEVSGTWVVGRKPATEPGLLTYSIVDSMAAACEAVIENGGPHFKFTEAISFVVNCKTQKEVDFFWKKLSASGKEVQCGRLKDKYGLSWQIVPTILGELLSDKDARMSQRVTQAMLQMIKLDIKKLSGRTSKNKPVSTHDVNEGKTQND
jgi:predicted 3-demethylubiquinone-9 3-methyltransferase (glyoxalase superfamily)